ncbi:hypothetical protein GYMLUDRAFT_289486 [Collybiopsis luxurians FD-317 M1]|nr:hypothetical protein GYMLUDRAFT_289486 [Collybiopsis luxurians FD-317 M1]
MLDLFKKDANGANSAIDVFTSGGSASLSGSGTGVTPDDPIRIDSGELSLTTEVGMVITSAGNGVAILEPIDVVERIVREKERKARDDEMKEQKSKLLSVVTPRYQPELLRDTMHSSYLPSNPLETPVVPEGAPSSTFPAPYTRPAPETRFRLDPKHPWGPRPTLPRPNWSRIAPPSSYEIPVANAGNQSKDPRISKRSSKKLSKVDQTAQQKRDEAFASDWSLMEERLEKYMWGLDSEAPSSTPGQSIGETSSKSNSFSAVKEKTNTEYLCDLRGVCLDAATCAYTYVLPKAPFRAFVKGSLSGEAGGTDHSASTLNISVSSSQKQQRKQKKPAALGPKRKPRNAPSNSRAKSSESAPSVASSRELTPALQRQGSTSSLSSSNSDSSSPRPATPPSEPSVDATVIEAEIPLGFPEGFTAISTFEEYGVEMPNYYNFHEYTTGTSKASADVSRSAESAVASLIDAAPSLSPDHPSLSSTAKSSESIFSSQSFPAAASTQPTFPTSVTGFDYAFGNPYANSSSYPDNLSSSTKNMASGMHMINALIDDAGSTSNLGVSTAQVNHGFAAPPHSTSSATAWGVSNAGVNFYMASVNTGMNANYGMSFHALSGGGMW